MNRILTASRPQATAATGVLSLPLDLALGLQRQLGRLRWRRARPFAHLNDHLRRDVGLPPAARSFDRMRPHW